MLPSILSFNLRIHRTTLCRRLSVTLLHSIPQYNPKVLLSEDRNCDGFLPWLESKAGIEISSVLSIGNSANYGRFIQSGDCILKVPYSVVSALITAFLQISPENILPEIKPLLGNDVGNIAKLAIVILSEQKKGQDSEWASYIGCLPLPGEIHSTIFWDEDELKMIKPSSVCNATGNQRSQIIKEYLVVKPVLDRFPEFFQDCTIDDFTHAYALVGSRAWGSMKGLSLIPFADFLNHDGTSVSLVLSDDLKQISEVIADRNYAPGEEILIRYGKFPNSTLLMDFGFTLAYNIHDQVQIQIDIPDHDHLRTMKLDILHRHHFSAIKDTSFNSTGGSFLIKELRSSKGNGKGIPQSLRAFARVLSCSSPEELNELVKEADETDGRLARRPLMNTSREIYAHRFLLSKINELIDEYKSSIKSLRLSKLNHSENKHSIRRQMALDLLSGEVRVLSSASEWLKNYCITYKEQM
ncbi:hypothetical protein V2J09_008294 [Rumex salicifolius]